MSYTRRALWAAGGVIGTAAAVDYFPNVGLFFLAPVAKVKSGAKITCDEIVGPLHSGKVELRGLRVVRPSGDSPETVTDVDVDIKSVVLTYSKSAISEKTIDSVEVTGARGRACLAPRSPPFEPDGFKFGSITARDSVADVSRYSPTTQVCAAPITVRVDSYQVDSVQIGPKLVLDLLLRSSVEGAAGDNGHAGKFYIRHTTDDKHEWHVEKISFEDVYPLALPSSALPLDWLQGSFDLNVTGSARLSEHPYRIDLSCDARLHDLRAEVPERHDQGVVGLAAATVVRQVNSRCGPEYSLRYTVDLDESKLAEYGDLGSAAAGLVLSALGDALARDAAASWLDSISNVAQWALKLVGMRS